MLCNWGAHNVLGGGGGGGAQTEKILFFFSLERLLAVPVGLIRCMLPSVATEGAFFIEIWKKCYKSYVRFPIIIGFYFSNRLNFWILAIQISKKNQKVKREKVIREMKSKKFSRRKRSSKIFYIKKTHTFTIIISNFVRGQLKISIFGTFPLYPPPPPLSLAVR